MNPLYDLRYAADHFVGIGTYAYCTFEKLLDLPGPERWSALWDPSLAHTRFDLDALRRHPRLRWIEAPAPPLSWGGMRALSAVLVRERPDVSVSPFHLLPRRPPCPAVVTIHDVRPLRFASELPLWKRLPYRWALGHTRAAHAVATPSAFAREEVLDYLPLDPERVHVVPPGTNEGLAAATPQRPERAPDPPFALVVGDNRPHKNLELLAQAWAQDPPPFPLVGAGPVHARHPGLDALARQHGARDVIALGRVSEAELAWLYRHARVLCFPSRYEGFGSPIAEAMRFGVPIVASGIQVLAETAGGAASYRHPDVPREWADEVRRLAADGEARDARVRAAHARSATLTYDATARRMLELARAAAAR